MMMDSTDVATAVAGPPPPPRSRLMILKMEVENFKSYGGVKEIGPFHKSFSSVVGPNGSGKSNVIDAMLFVFGKKSDKLRMKKVRFSLLFSLINCLMLRKTMLHEHTRIIIIRKRLLTAECGTARDAAPARTVLSSLRG